MVPVGKTRRKKPLRKPSGRWEGDFKMEIKATGWESMTWINLPRHMNRQRYLLNTVNTLPFSKNGSKFFDYAREYYLLQKDIALLVCVVGRSKN
jgi:hypothetical protein